MKTLVSCGLMLALATSLFAQQPPEVTDHHKELHKDVGVWDGTMKMWTAPGGEPMEMPLVETNTLLPGDIWVQSKFDCGPFQGGGVFGYDTQKEKYVGTWIDNMSTHLSVMHGNMNDDGELVMEATSVNPENGKEYPIKSVSKFEDDNTKMFTMFGKMGGSDEWTKMFEIKYKRRPDGGEK